MSEPPVQEQERALPISMPRALGRPLVALFDRLGLVVAANLLFTGALLVPLSISYLLREPMNLGAALTVLSALLITGPVWFGLVDVMGKIVGRESVSFFDLLLATGKHYIKAVGWGLFALAGLVITWAAGTIYLGLLALARSDGLGSPSDWLLLASAGLFGLAAAALILIQLYVAPLITLNNEPLSKAFRKAALLALDNLPLTLLAWLELGAGILVVLLPSTLAELLQAAGDLNAFTYLFTACLYWSFAALVATSVTLALLRKYGLSADDFYDAVRE